MINLLNAEGGADIGVEEHSFILKVSLFVN